MSKPIEEPQEAPSLRGRGVLVVDDEDGMRELLGIVLENEGYRVFPARDGSSALDLFQREKDHIDLVIQDLKMPGMDGVDLLRKIKETSSELPVIIITAFSTWDSAVEAMRLGAYDYLRKPFDTEVIRSVVNRAIEQRLIFSSSPESLRGELSYKSEIIGNNPLMQGVFEMIKRIAPTDSTVLIQGESGTGKELAARAIHYRSYRRNKVFLSANCSAFTESLLESELFGHIRGAFTGAIENKQGLFQAAHQGTLFLDEVADMSLTTQVKILRVLEERKVSPVGSTRAEPIDVRIIAATNKDIEAEVKEGSFREDLYYRLNVIPLTLPPLRDRKDDIPLLAGYFLAKYSRQMRKCVTNLSAQARSALLEYDWPGNVRELENIIQRHVALAGGACIETIQIQRHAAPAAIKLASPLADELRIPDAGIELEDLLENFEKAHILEALKKTNGNLTNAAKLLGMSYRSIRYRVKKLGIKEAIRA
ncbi:MAG: sigma-54-dependent Fis family transcriptional regulator [Planctomycetes bacterium]|nr:sigma-54-dependent Fis family transcriptional regulator [Planctomycetota bacterium]